MAMGTAAGHSQWLVSMSLGNQIGTWQIGKNGNNWQNQLYSWRNQLNKIKALDAFQLAFQAKKDSPAMRN
jgi:hypothetical protein